MVSCPHCGIKDRIIVLSDKRLCCMDCGAILSETEAEEVKTELKRNKLAKEIENARNSKIL